MSSSKRIVLVSSDNATFEMDETAAKQSQTIKHIIEDDCTKSRVLIPNVTGLILAKVTEYLKKHDAKAEQGELKSFDAEFIRVDTPILFDLVLAADCLDIKGLLDLTCQTVEDLIENKPPEERTTFNIKNDFTPEKNRQFARRTLGPLSKVF